ncbi:hypothetical protein ACLOJK_010532 [Asimina triloba]
MSLFCFQYQSLFSLMGLVQFGFLNFYSPIAVKASRNVLKDLLLCKYGKEVDAAKEGKRLGQTHNERAAAVVKDYDLPLTPEEFLREIMPYYKARQRTSLGWADVKPLPGANRLINHLHKHGIPFALASNSVQEDIELKISHHKGWKESFSVILGRNEVKSGKPAPDLFLEAAKRMDVDAASCLVIEDSLPGINAAKAAGMKVVAVTSPLTQAKCFSVAHCILHSLLEFQPEKWSLPAFDDWLQNALPIETLHIKDQASNESLPDQVAGVYFGWAEIGTYGTFKMVVTIGWNLYLGIAKRVIRPCILHVLDKDASGEQAELWIVGYVQKLHSKENIMAALEISQEDKSTAEAALDLPTFGYQHIAASAKENACCNSKCTGSSNGSCRSGEKHNF